MVTLMRSLIRRLLALSAAAVALAVVGLISVSFAYADHTTRATEIQENGINLWYLALTITIIVTALVVFAAAVLVWERRDAAAKGASGTDATPHGD